VEGPTAQARFRFHGRLAWSQRSAALIPCGGPETLPTKGTVFGLQSTRRSLPTTWQETENYQQQWIGLNSHYRGHENARPRAPNPPGGVPVTEWKGQERHHRLLKDQVALPKCGSSARARAPKGPFNIWFGPKDERVASSCPRPTHTMTFKTLDTWVDQ